MLNGSMKTGRRYTYLFIVSIAFILDWDVNEISTEIVGISKEFLKKIHICIAWMEFVIIISFFSVDAKHELYLT